MLHIKFQASKPIRSEEGKKMNNFLCISMVEPRSPWRGAILNEFVKEPLGNATYQISRMEAKWF